MDDLYDTDFALWAERQASALRLRSSNEIDWDNVAEEIESLSRSDKRQIHNRLVVICTHLLKWRFQPTDRSSSRRASIVKNRYKIRYLIDEGPSLTIYPSSQLATAYEQGRRIAMLETSIADLPEQCPWTIAEVLNPDFWPN